MAKAIAKLPKNSTLSIRSRYGAQVLARAGEMYDILDKERGPVTNARLRQEMDLEDNPEQYRTVKRALVRAPDTKVYVSQDGLVLHKYATKDQQYWHVAWSLGLFEISSIQLEMDEELLMQAPGAVARLLVQGKYGDSERKRLQYLSNRAIEASGFLLRLARMYQEVHRQIEIFQRPEIRGKDLKATMQKMKKLMEKSTY
ncbi:MAG: hypothetical protein ACE5JX_03720 [Acidobacteriota bacterium]